MITYVNENMQSLEIRSQEEPRLEVSLVLYAFILFCYILIFDFNPFISIAITRVSLALT